MATLEEIRAKLLAQTQKSEGKSSGGGDRAFYPFWNTPEGKTALIRFLPDGDPDNSFFWVERLIIRLPFQGIKGEHNNEVTVQVPCMEMYGKPCPILTETRPWWKDDSLQDLARKYWKKKSYLFQGFVVESAFTEEQTPENPIRRFAINSSIFDIIKSSLMNPEMEDLPIDYTSGRDFKLAKTIKGQFANYSTSNWSFKTRSLNDSELGAIDQYGLFNLKEFLPKEPGETELAVIKDMFQASVNDEPYDPIKWGDYFRPYGSFKSEGSAPATTAATPAPAKAAPAAKAAPVAEEDEAPSTSSGSAQDPKEILARIRNRHSK